MKIHTELELINTICQCCLDWADEYAMENNLSNKEEWERYYESLGELSNILRSLSRGNKYEG